MKTKDLTFRVIYDMIFVYWAYLPNGWKYVETKEVSG